MHDFTQDEQARWNEWLQAGARNSQRRGRARRMLATSVFAVIVLALALLSLLGVP